MVGGFPTHSFEGMTTEDRTSILQTSFPSAPWRGEPLLLRAGSSVKEKAEVRQDPSLGRGKRAILCAACRHEITRERHRIQVADGHEHRFFNPAGHLFHIGCFRSAPGCRSEGNPTMEFTWFPGFAWCYALCGGCSAHLGWKFESGAAEVFFGLVLNRLIVMRHEA